jgi:dextranase
MNRQTTRKPRAKSTWRLRPLLLPVIFAFVQSSQASGLMESVTTDASRYNPGAVATISVNLANAPRTPRKGRVEVTLKHLGLPVASLPVQKFELAGGGGTRLSFPWTTPKEDFTGYSVEVSALGDAGELLDTMNSAVDVSSVWTKFPRYGYVGSYQAQAQSNAECQVGLLNNYHLNGVQFYDWQWKHHVPLAGMVPVGAPSWQQINAQSNCAQTVRDYIDAAHARGMAAMNYNLVYGAWDGYGEDGSGVNYQWGLFRNAKGTDQWKMDLPANWATRSIYMFDPGNKEWQKYIYAREKEVFDAYGFDGWHADQIGHQGDMYSANGNAVDYGAEFPGFLKGAATALNRTIVFNAVAGYGLPGILPEEAFAYVECWPSSSGGTQNNYNDLKSVVDGVNAANPGQGVVLAAYMDYARARGSAGTFNAPGVLLADAAIFAIGASHLELGAGIGGRNSLQMLDNEYFPNTNLAPSAPLLATLQGYYDFDVAYENLLRGQLANNGNMISLGGLPSASVAATNEVWTFAKNNGGDHMVNFINLLNATNTDWRDDGANYPVPPIQTNVTVTYRCGEPSPCNVYWATPDTNNGRMSPLTFTLGSDDDGNYVRFSLPSLAYWDMVYLTTNFTTNVPVIPAGLNVITGNARAFLSWNASANAASYNIYRSAQNGVRGSAFPVTNTVTTAYTDDGLTNGTAYSYKVEAVSPSGNSRQSAEVSATPVVPEASAHPPAGRRIAILSMINGLFVTGTGAPSGALVADSRSVGPPQMFDVIALPGNGRDNFALRSVANGLYVSVNQHGGNLEAVATKTPTAWESFAWNAQGKGEFSIYSPASGYYVSTNIKGGNSLQALFAKNATSWERYQYVDAGPTP